MNNKAISAKIVDFPEYNEKEWLLSQWEHFKEIDVITVEFTDGTNKALAYFRTIEEINKYGGVDELCKFAKIYYSDFSEKWFADFDFSPWENDPANNPHKIIELDYVGEKDGTNESIFKKRGETQRNKFILRQNGNERFKPVYLTATKITQHDGVWLEGDCPLRPNIEIKAYGKKGNLMHHEITKALPGGEIIAEVKI